MTSQQTLHIWRKVRLHRSSRLPSSYKVSLNRIGRVNCCFTPGSTTTVVLCLEEVVALQPFPTSHEMWISPDEIGFWRVEIACEWRRIVFARSGFSQAGYESCRKKMILGDVCANCIDHKKNKWIKNFLFPEKFWYSPPCATF